MCGGGGCLWEGEGVWGCGVVNVYSLIPRPWPNQIAKRIKLCEPQIVLL